VLPIARRCPFCKGGRQVIALDLKRFRRRHPDQRGSAAIQRDLDSWAGFVHFLYCSGWGALGTLFYTLKWGKSLPWWCWIAYAGSSAALVVAAMIGDCRLTTREVEIVRIGCTPNQHSLRGVH
jgi:hypothetical protein